MPEVESYDLAQAMRRLGSSVTIIERGTQLAGREDADVGEAVHELCRDEGIDVLLNAEAARVDGRSGQGVRVRTASAGGSLTMEGLTLLLQNVATV